jgi:hypothetical protein
LGESTDYYIDEKLNVFTESKIGLKLGVWYISTDIALCKPWCKAYLNKKNSYFTANLGFLFHEKKLNLPFGLQGRAPTSCQKREKDERCL